MNLRDQIARLKISPLRFVTNNITKPEDIDSMVIQNSSERGDLGLSTLSIQIESGFKDISKDMR